MAMAAPIAPDAPVTTTTFPARSVFMHPSRIQPGAAGLSPPLQLDLVQQPGGDPQTVPHCRESGVWSHLQYGFDNFLFCGSITKRHPHVEFERACSPERRQCRNRAQAARLHVERGPRPYLDRDKTKNELL